MIIFYDGHWSAQFHGATFDLYGVSAYDQNSAWAVGACGGVLKWEGGAWIEQATGLPGPFFDIVALDSTHVWAVGQGGAVAFYDGAAWKAQDSGTANTLSGVCAVDASHVWAVGASGTVRFYNGAAWSGQTSGTTQWLNDVAAADGRHAWAVGSGQELLFFDGSGWHGTETDAVNGLNSVSAVDARHAWAVGTDGCILSLTGGTTWTRQTSGTTADLYSVSAAAVDRVWAVGEAGAVRRFDGGAWTAQGCGATGDFHAATAPDGGHVWVAGSEGAILLGTAAAPTTSRAWGTASVGSAAPASEWYLAEGCTGPGFETWVLVENPQGSPAKLQIDYMTAGGRVAGPRPDVPAHSRLTVNVAAHVPGNWSVSTMVTSDREVVVERAMYGAGRAWGHDSLGASTPASEWYLAEGCTGPGFETWVLVQNPNDATAQVHLTYMTPAGDVAGPWADIPPNARRTFNVADTVPGVFDIATRVDSSKPVVVERAMYGADRAWGTGSVGSPRSAEDWYLAEGCTAGGFETWVLVQNPNSAAVRVELTYMTPAGEAGTVSEALGPYARGSFSVGNVVPGAWEVSTRVRSTGPVVVERAVYGSGRAWAHDSVGAEGTATEWYLAEGSTGAGFETWVLVQNPGGRPARVTVTYYTAAGRVSGPVVSLPAGSRTSFNVGETVPGAWDVSTKVSSDEEVVVERSVYGDAN